MIFTAREPAASGNMGQPLIQSLDKAVAEHDKALAEETISDGNQPDFKALIEPVSRLFSKY